MSWRHLFRSFASRTQPTPEAVDRLRARLAAPGPLLRAATRRPHPDAMFRLEARLRRPRQRPAVSVFRPVVVGVVLGLLMLLVVGDRWLPPLDLELRATAETTRAVGRHVHLSYRGLGTLRGTEAAPRIRWDVGSLGVEVTPGQGIRLEVETEDAHIRVVGTEFLVVRDTLGTQVQVQHGRVAVVCADGAPAELLDPGEAALCLPARAAGILGRVRALRASGASSEAQLEAVERGLVIGEPGEPAVGELIALKVEILAGSGRVIEAMDAARVYLERGGPREAEIRALMEVLEER